MNELELFETPAEPEKMMTTGELADALGISESTLKRTIEKGAVL